MAARCPAEETSLRQDRMDKAEVSYLGWLCASNCTKYNSSVCRVVISLAFSIPAPPISHVLIPYRKNEHIV